MTLKYYSILLYSLVCSPFCIYISSRFSALSQLVMSGMICSITLISLNLFDLSLYSSNVLSLPSILRVFYIRWRFISCNNSSTFILIFFCYRNRVILFFLSSISLGRSLQDVQCSHFLTVYLQHWHIFSFLCMGRLSFIYHFVSVRAAPFLCSYSLKVHDPGIVYSFSI